MEQEQQEQTAATMIQARCRGNSARRMRGAWTARRFVDTVQLIAITGAERPCYIGEALFDYDGADDDDLSFSAGASIEVLTDSVPDLGEGWSLGRVEGGVSGFFPTKFVRQLPLRRELLEYERIHRHDRDRERRDQRRLHSSGSSSREAEEPMPQRSSAEEQGGRQDQDGGQLRSQGSDDTGSDDAGSGDVGGDRDVISNTLGSRDGDRGAVVEELRAELAAERTVRQALEQQQAACDSRLADERESRICAEAAAEAEAARANSLESQLVAATAAAHDDRDSESTAAIVRAKVQEEERAQAQAKAAAMAAAHQVQTEAATQQLQALQQGK
jgi:hypothetical protein